MLVLAGMACGAQAEERVLRFRPADAGAVSAWRAILRADAALARDARREGFVPARGLAALRADLDGDGRPELFLYADTRSYCGSAGCVVRVLTHRRGRWVVACETYADDGVGPVLDDARSAGWRNLRGTYRVTWRADAAHPAGVACVEGEEVPRPEQGRVAGRHP